MAGLRRSARIKDVPEVDYNFSSRADENDYFEEEEHRSSAKRRNVNEDGFSSSKKAKLAVKKLSREELEDNFKELSEEFIPTKLFNALAFEDTEDDDQEFSINRLVNEWLDLYEADAIKGRKEIINLILNCCGALNMAEAHDVNDTTTAETTVTEFEIFFEKQAIFEFYLLNSKNNDKKSTTYKHLFKNFTDFFKEMIIVADQRGLLAIEIEDPEDDDEELTVNPLVFDLLIWFSKFSISNLTAFRFVATIALYEIQTAIIKLIPGKNAQTQSLRSMINKEENKKRKNQKAIDNWNEKLQGDLAYINILKSIVDDSLAACFEHRVRDSDAVIRSISLHYLEQWIETLSSKFYHSNYLKCFGWLLSDVSTAVRSSALSSVAHTIKFVVNKSNNVITPLEAFVKKYKFKIVDIIFNDKEMECRILAGETINLLIELGWISKHESLSISSLIFMDFADYQIRPTVSAKNKESRFLSTISKIFFKVESSALFTKGKIGEVDFEGDVDMSDNELEKSNSLSSDVPKYIVTSQDNYDSMMNFIKFFLSSFSCFVAVSRKACTYETFNIENSQIEIESFEPFHEVIMQAMEFLSLKFKSKLFGLSKFIVTKNDFSNTRALTSNFDKFVMNSISKTELPFILLNGFCEGLYEQNKNSSDVFAPYVVQYLPQLFKEYMNSGTSSKEIELLINLLLFFRHDQFSSDSVLDEITSTIQKTFLGDMIIANNDIVKKNAFISLFSFYEQNSSTKYSSFWRNEMHTLLDRAVIYMEKTVFVDSEKYPDTNFDVFTNELFLLYINKIVLMARFFGVTISEKFWLLFEKTVTNNVVSFIDELNNNDVISFEIYFVDVLSKAKELQSGSNTAIDYEIQAKKTLQTFSKLKSLLIELFHIEYEAEVLRLLRFNVGNTLLDVYLVYESVFNEGKFSSDKLYISDSILDYLKQIFIAQEKKVLIESASKSDLQKDELINLCTFVLKIKKLLSNEKVNKLESSIWQRVVLNSNKLGPDYMYILS